MKNSVVKTRIEVALTMLFARDGFLLEHKTGERTVVARLAWYMALLFPNYDVDVEYNRQGLDPNDPKVLVLGPECRGGGKKKVFPDIIVHRRGDLRGHNLLVVEVKRSSNKESRSCDRAKIDAMKTKYRYRFGVFIELPTGRGAVDKEPTLEWR